ncbi:MAG TPA: hypothetical protein VHB79_19175 [Polyangiaceae bacterium]|nr:hypothetical protein [Polyangiaceae bacterium]
MSLARLVASAAAFAALVVITPSARAEPASPLPCSPARHSVDYAACSLAEQLGAAAHGAGVSIVSLKSDRELPAPDQLRQRLQRALETALESRPKAAGRDRLVVELSVEKVGGSLRFTADLKRAVGLWQRARHQKPRAEQHAFKEVPLDEELRVLIPPPPLVVGSVTKIKAPERGIVALACGPLAEDGAQELAIVSRSNVRVGRVVKRTFAERKRAAWTTLSAIAAVPLREPLASAEFTPNGWLRISLSDRAYDVDLGPDLSVRDQRLRQAPAVAGVDATASTGALRLGRDSSSGKLISLQPSGVVPPLHVGAQLALGDADDDGNPELLYSVDTLDAAKDRLSVVTLQGAQAKPRFELPAPGISAVAVCQRREGPGMAAMVVATADELWLIQ